MPRIVAALVGLALLVSTAVAVKSDPLKEGRELYKAGKYQQAVMKLEQATREDPDNPKAWWQLNFAYNKLERYADALRAAETAGKLDPSYGFASEPGKYRETVDRLRRKVGASARGSLDRPLIEDRRPEPPLDNAMVRQLTSTGMFIQSGMNINKDRLAAVMRELKPVEVRFLVYNNRAGSAALTREADRVRNYLSLGNGYVIACSRAGVAVSSKSLSRDTLRELTRQVAPQMEGGDFTGGLERLARGLAATRQAQVVRTRTTAAAVGGGLGVLVVGWVITRRIRHKRSMTERRAVIEQARSEIISQINHLEESVSIAPPALSSTVKQARLDAGKKLDEASRIIVRARSEYDLTRAQRLLDEALACIAMGRDALEGKAPSSRSASSTRDMDPPVYAEARTASGPATDWDAVPESERGVCFFCSRPSFLSELTPVTMDLEGETRRVLACADDYRSIKTGEPPRVRAFDRGGRYVPWYADEAYDPYRDYYGRGYGDRSLLSDLVLYSMIDRMFWDWRHPSWTWGGGRYHDPDGYAFSPDHHRWQDHHLERAASRGFDREDRVDGAGTDFLGSGFDDMDSRSGGTDFLGSDDS